VEYVNTIRPLGLMKAHQLYNKLVYSFKGSILQLDVRISWRG